MSSSSSSLDTPKITVIYDNRSADTNLKEGFGFSCLVEWENRRILFDTGGDAKAFFENTAKLEISLERITHLFFSHHHWDHTAAIAQVMAKISKNAVVYVPSCKTLIKKIPPEADIKIVKDVAQVDEKVYSLVLQGGYCCTSITEQCLLLDTRKGVVIISGCAHPGIVKIIEETKKLLNKPVHMVLGGFHLHHSWASTSAKVVRKFKELEVEKVAPCHCAGKTAITQFQKAYGSNFLETATGTILKI